MCQFVKTPGGSENRDQKEKQTHLSGPGSVALGQSQDYKLSCVYSWNIKDLRLSEDQRVMLKYNLLTPDHSAPHSQLVYTKLPDMPYAFHVLFP